MGLFFFALLVTLPAYPRYKFDRDVRSKILGAEHVHVINKTYWGAITEPLTWFSDYIGSAHAAFPEGPLSPNTFRHVVMRYEDAPRVFAVKPNCEDRLKDVSEPDVKGVFRYTGSNQKMTEADFQLYCQKNWDSEKEAIRQMYLKLFRKNKTQ